MKARLLAVFLLSMILAQTFMFAVPTVLQRSQNMGEVRTLQLLYSLIDRRVSLVDGADSMVLDQSPSAWQSEFASIYSRIEQSPTQTQPLTALPSANPTSGPAPLWVQFYGSASGGVPPYQWLWHFGDGSAPSTQQNPTHQFWAQNFDYTVTLTVWDSGGNGPVTGTLQIYTTSGQPFTVSISASPTSGTAPLTVQFSQSVNGGTPPYSYNWDFGDGVTSQTENPAHYYANPGTYAVTLTVTDSAGVQATSNTIQIVVTEAPTQLTASASANPTSGSAPLTVQFLGSASGGTPPYSFDWDFGDGVTSQTQNPAHYYANAGTYIVTLTVADQAQNKAQSTVTITVSPVTPTQESLITGVLSGQGTVAPDCPSPMGCQENVGAAITVSASAANGWVFSSWTISGASCAGGSQGNPCQFAMPSNQVTILATFTQVQPPNTPPQITISSPVVNCRTVTIDGTATATTPGASITRVHVDWGDGQSEDNGFPAIHATHTYPSDGTYTITATAYDSNGLSTTQRITVTIACGPTGRPNIQISITCDKNSLVVGDTTNCAITISNVGSASAVNIDVSVSLGVFLELVSGSLSWQYDSLNAGASDTRSLTVRGRAEGSGTVYVQAKYSDSQGNQYSAQAFTNISIGQVTPGQCPYSIKTHDSASVWIHICPDEVQKIDNTNLLEAWQVVSVIQMEVLLQTLPTPPQMDAQTFVLTIAPMLYSFVKKMIEDAAFRAKLLQYVKEETLGQLKSFLLNMVIDRIYAAICLLGCVALGCTTEVRNDDGSIDVRIDWLTEGVSFVLGQLINLYIGLGAMGAQYLLSQLNVELPNSNNVALSETGSKLYLHVYDSQNRHVGFDKSSNSIEIRIPGALYYDSGKAIMIQLPPEITEFRYVVDATSAQGAQETYHVAVFVVSNDVVAQTPTLIDGTISGKELQERSVQISPDGTWTIIEPNPILRYWMELTMVFGATGLVTFVYLYRTKPKKGRPIIVDWVDGPRIIETTAPSRILEETDEKR
jgi:PKD repeat protein